MLPGGNKVWSCYYETISYAITHNNPLLGICLGMEGMAIFSCVYEKMNKPFSKESFYQIYDILKEKNDGTLLQRIESPNMHGDVIVSYNNTDEASHEINIVDKNSILYDILKRDELSVVSLHHFNPKWVGKDFKITARSLDNVIEAIEYDSKEHFIVGVHFHPEWDSDLGLFRRLILESKKRQDN